MKTKHLKVVVGTLLTAGAVRLVLSGESFIQPAVRSSAALTLTSTGRGSAEELAANYREWALEYERNGGDRRRSRVFPGSTSDSRRTRSCWTAKRS